ncbi:MAG: hypothetical protein Q8P68_03425 [Candidatus Peregrinibacteria bacterium]|nr:hypothetical protein [Candidatus Peregrinibacteria bacterium]
MSRHKFQYRNDRPTITARLWLKGTKPRYFEFLVDSGADFTLISRSDGMFLGLDYSKIKGEEVKIEVANMAILHTKKVKMMLEFCDNTFEIPVLIAKEEVERLLGRNGVFDRFDVTFKEKDQEVVFEER